MVYLKRLEEIDDGKRARFLAEFAQVKKDVTVGVLFALFLGGVGAHRYYMGQCKIGLVYTLLCWTLIPAMVAFVEIFLMPGRVRIFNERKANEIIDRYS